MKTNTHTRATPRLIVTVAEYNWMDALGNTYGDSMRLTAKAPLSKAEAAKRVREYVSTARITQIYSVE